MGNPINQSAYNITNSKAWVQNVFSQNVNKRSSWILESIHNLIVKFRARNEVLKGEKREKFINEMADEYLRHQSLSTKERHQLTGVYKLAKGQRDTSDIGEFMKYVRIGLTENKVKDRVALENDIRHLIEKRAALKEDWTEDLLPGREGSTESRIDTEMDASFNEILSDSVRYVVPGTRQEKKPEPERLDANSTLVRLNSNPLFGLALDADLDTDTDLVELGRRAGLYESGYVDTDDLATLFR